MAPWLSNKISNVSPYTYANKKSTLTFAENLHKYVIRVLVQDKRLHLPMLKLIILALYS